MKFKSLLLSALCLGTLLASCSDDGPAADTLPEKDAAFRAIAENYLDNTVIATYRHLADEASALADDLAALRNDKSDANVEKACASFLSARAWWEKSEAFLFGAAGDFGIDPHIDSWPLDRAGLEAQMANSRQLENLAAEDGDVWAGSHLGPELLGFHGIEYIIFADGQPKNADRIPDNQLIYAVAVAGDLRNKCWQLLVSWAGADNVDTRIRSKVVDELEWPHTTGAGLSYRDNMLCAGQAGSTYRSWTDAVQAIADGCATIADEVGTQKIGKPYSGEDVNYIESPYSQKSIADFLDNIVSIENAYLGGIEGRRNSSASLHAYLTGHSPETDRRCMAAIEEAKLKISMMKAPFVKNYSDISAKEAADACSALEEAMVLAKEELAK